MPNPFLYLRSDNQEENDDSEPEDVEEEVAVVATYFDATNRTCKRIFSNGLRVDTKGFPNLALGQHSPHIHPYRKMASIHIQT
jgi:hypothetical protein